MGALRNLFFVVLLAGMYVLGARFGLPDWVMAQLDSVIARGVERTEDLGQRAIVELEREASVLTDRFDRSHVYDDDTAPELTVSGASVEIVPPPAIVFERSAPLPVVATDETGDAFDMKICLNSVSNSPPTDEELNIVGFTEEISIEGVSLLLAPASNACLSSGFGPRGSSGRIHKGIDYFSKAGGDVLAAADGIVVEAMYRDDYGYMVVIDHGDGIYTRYAHLKRIEDRYTDEGVRVSQGDVLGPIGNSGAYTDVVHLHYEILQGDYDTPRKSFGLIPLNPYAGLMP
ncbi:MAG: M23 family metallopeptidase [Pseudomonadota bacterium]